MLDIPLIKPIVCAEKYYARGKYGKHKLTQSTNPWPPFVHDSVLMIGGFPVISSKSTTPNEYTSDFSVNLPLDAYSGARYLKN